MMLWKNYQPIKQSSKPITKLYHGHSLIYKICNGKVNLKKENDHFSVNLLAWPSKYVSLYKPTKLKIYI